MILKHAGEQWHKVPLYTAVWSIHGALATSVLDYMYYAIHTRIIRYLCFHTCVPYSWIFPLPGSTGAKYCD